MTFDPRFRRALCWMSLLFLFAVVCGNAAAESIHLVVLHTNDSHGNLLASDGADTPGDAGGIARTATVVRQTRDENPGKVLLVHAGDVLSRCDALTDASKGRLNFKLMKRIGYDAFTPGNGEFYGGIDRLVACQRASRLTFVRADLAMKASGKRPFPPYTIKKVAGLRIGILGLGVVRAEHPASAPLSILDAFDQARRFVPELREKADLVLVLSHLGYEDDQALAAQVPGIDLIVGAHDHLVLTEPTRVTGPDGRVVPIVQAGDCERYLGRMDLDIERTPDGAHLARAEGRLIPLDASITPDPRILATLQRKIAPLRRTVCTVAVTLPNPEEGRSPLAERLAEEIRDAVHADVMLLDRGAVNAPLKAGPVSRSDLYRIHPYHNRIFLLRLTGAQLRDALTEAGDYVAAGCTFTRTDTGISELRIGGTPIDENRTYCLAAGDYGRYQLPSVKNLPATDSGLGIDAILLDALKSGKLSKPVPVQTGRLEACPLLQY